LTWSGRMRILKTDKKMIQIVKKEENNDMKKYLALALTVTCLALALAGCGCDHEVYSTITKEPVAGEVGVKEQICSVCGESVATEEYVLSATHDGTNYTLTVAEYSSRLNNILSSIRSDLSCRIENNAKEEPAIYVFWQEDGYLSMIIPQTAEEEALTDINEYPGGFRNLTQLNTTQQTTGDDPVPVFELQMDVLQAMIMACDPQISGEDARQIVMDFLNGEEQYVFENHGTLEYYFFLSNLGQPILSLALSPIK